MSSSKVIYGLLVIATLGFIIWFRNDKEELYEEARLNRIRILNQQGQLPGEWDY